MSNLLVLVHAHEIEPLIFVRTRLEELDVSVTKCAKQPLVSHIAHAIEGKLRAPFLKENRLYGNAVRLGRSSVVVDQARHLQEV